jgi:hypothetical protein
MATAKKKAAQLPEGLKVPPGNVALIGGNCSFDGQEYLAEGECVIVPEAAAKILEEHGFKRLEQ